MDLKPQDLEDTETPLSSVGKGIMNPSSHISTTVSSTLEYNVDINNEACLLKGRFLQRIRSRRQTFHGLSSLEGCNGGEWCAVRDLRRARRETYNEDQNMVSKRKRSTRTKKENEEEEEEEEEGDVEEEGRRSRKKKRRKGRKKKKTHASIGLPEAALLCLNLIPMAGSVQHLTDDLGLSAPKMSPEPTKSKANHVRFYFDESDPNFSSDDQTKEKGGKVSLDGSLDSCMRKLNEGKKVREVPDEDLQFVCDVENKDDVKNEIIEEENVRGTPGERHECACDVEDIEHGNHDEIREDEKKYVNEQSHQPHQSQQQHPHEPKHHHHRRRHDQRQSCSRIGDCLFRFGSKRKKRRKFPESTAAESAPLVDHSLTPEMPKQPITIDDLNNSKKPEFKASIEKENVDILSSSERPPSPADGDNMCCVNNPQTEHTNHVNVTESARNNFASSANLTATVASTVTTKTVTADSKSAVENDLPMQTTNTATTSPMVTSDDSVSSSSSFRSGHAHNNGDGFNFRRAFSQKLRRKPAMEGVIADDTEDEDDRLADLNLNIAQPGFIGRHRRAISLKRHFNHHPNSHHHHPNNHHNGRNNHNGQGNHSNNNNNHSRQDPNGNPFQQHHQQHSHRQSFKNHIMSFFDHLQGNDDQSPFVRTGSLNHK